MNRERHMIVSSDYLREMQRWSRRKRRLVALLTTSGVVVVGLYFTYQLRDWILLPDLLVDRPADGVTLRGPEVVVEGVITPGVRLTINGIAAYNEENGHFRAELLLPAGLHTIRVVVENRFGRARSVERQVVVVEE